MHTHIRSTIRCEFPSFYRFFAAAAAANGFKCVSTFWQCHNSIPIQKQHTDCLTVSSLGFACFFVAVSNELQCQCGNDLMMKSKLVYNDAKKCGIFIQKYEINAKMLNALNWSRVDCRQCGLLQHWTYPWHFWQLPSTTVGHPDCIAAIFTKYLCCGTLKHQQTTCPNKNKTNQIQNETE